MVLERERVLPVPFLAFFRRGQAALRWAGTGGMRERGFAGGNVAISHCDNHAVAQALKEGILNAWEDSRIEILPTRGLCSYYAERGDLIVGF